MARLKHPEYSQLQLNNGREVPLMPASQVESMFGKLDLTRDIKTDADCLVAVYRFGGPEAVLETVAHGRLLNEIAIQLELPVMWFNEWVVQYVDGGKLEQAMRMGAETLMIKAQMVLAVDASSAHEAAQARALAAEYTKLAEKLDYQKWGARRADGLAGQVVNIQMNMGDGGSIGVGATIDAAPVEDAPVIAEDMSFEPAPPLPIPDPWVDQTVGYLSCELSYNDS